MKAEEQCGGKECSGGVSMAKTWFESNLVRNCAKGGFVENWRRFSHGAGAVSGFTLGEHDRD